MHDPIKWKPVPSHGWREPAIPLPRYTTISLVPTLVLFGFLAQLVVIVLENGYIIPHQNGTRHHSTSWTS